VVIILIFAIAIVLGGPLRTTFLSIFHGSNNSQNFGPGILSNATLYNGPEPAPSLINVTLNGSTTQVLAIPGQVLIFTTSSTSYEQADSLITSNQGRIIAAIPLLGFYMANVSLASEAAFISSIQSSNIIETVAPNMVLIRAGGSPVTSTDTLPQSGYPAPNLVSYPAPNTPPEQVVGRIAREIASISPGKYLNIGESGGGTGIPLVIALVDDFSRANSHGSEILAFLSALPSPAYSRAIQTANQDMIEVQDQNPNNTHLTLNDQVDVIAETISAAQEEHALAAISFSSTADVSSQETTALQGDQWFTGEKILLTVLQRQPGLVIQALGNANLDLNPAMHQLATDPLLGPTMFSSLMLIGQSNSSSPYQRATWGPFSSGGCMDPNYCGSSYGADAFMVPLPQITNPLTGTDYSGTSFATPLAALSYGCDLLCTPDVTPRYFASLANVYNGYTFLPGNNTGAYPNFGYTTTTWGGEITAAQANIDVSLYSGSLVNGLLDLAYTSGGSLYTPSVTCDWNYPNSNPPPSDSCWLPGLPSNSMIMTSDIHFVKGNMTIQVTPQSKGGFVYTAYAYIQGSGQANVLWAAPVGSTGTAQYCTATVDAKVTIGGSSGPLPQSLTVFSPPAFLERNASSTPLAPGTPLQINNITVNPVSQGFPAPFAIGGGTEGIVLGASSDPSCPFPATATWDTTFCQPRQPSPCWASGVGYKVTLEGLIDGASISGNVSIFSAYPLLGIGPLGTMQFLLTEEG
jgi:hypothetical protein